MILTQRHIVVAVCFASVICFRTVRSGSNVFQSDDDGSGQCNFVGSGRSFYIPHTKDCSKFFVCDNGVPHLRSCQPGLHFNSDQKACDYPESAGCDKNILKKPKEKTTRDLNSCPAVNPKFPVFLPDPEDCSQFYICDSGSRYLKECQSGLHFNLAIKACDYPEKAGCDTGERKKPKGKMTGDESSLCPAGNSQHPVLLPHSEDCHKFYICDGGSAHLKECQPGLHFNRDIKACDYPENARCFTDEREKPKGKMTEIESSLCPAGNSQHPVLLPHSEDCRKFYICDGGSAHLKECQSGLHYNPKIKACDYPENAKCDTGRTKAPGIPSPYCPARNGIAPIFFRHETNCSVYYMCGNGLAYEFVCPSRLYFNIRKSVCDYESRSGCRNASP